MLLQQVPSPDVGDDARARVADEFLGHAVVIAQHIAAELSGDQPGEARDSATPRATGTGPHLHDGTPGVAYFLAALDHHRGTAEYRDVCLRLLAPVRRTLREVIADPVRAERLRVSPGALTGIGGWIYSFARIGTWLGDTSLVEDASRTTRLLTPKRIAADQHFDVAGGCAGAVLALLVLDEVAADAGESENPPVALAAACGEHLLAARTTHSGRPRAWASPEHPPLSGFAHGASGIAHALLRLHERTGAQELRDAALEGFDYERALFDSDHRNWWDPRFGCLVERSAWCHGGPGIALARLMAPEAGLRDEGREILTPVREAPAPAADSLCCGKAGWADILASGSEVFDDPTLRLRGESILRELIRSLGSSGGARSGQERSATPLGLFDGLSGIGYVLLRYAAPRGALRSPLLLN